eukprot:CAMPEP_0198726758 /NCGR_PEP_ID=MMETSP1475-20131203/3710_1 /TAXON_ID= ORGANISM="Unidentified sp., Strain CCMP1999" /NCGR_SAMPLE_ID=MMETSP1475 /ASSEMBLY_ACC=CAM_ASM_001111 /LENGTH=175 /DNA_ID=CAMNT_0044488719 /DNA_START=100 /DNA_END=627 /DNA_ORIENTATION=-
MDYTRLSIGELQVQVSQLHTQLSGLETLHQSDPDNEETKDLLAEVQEFIKILKDLIAEKQAAEKKSAEKNAAERAEIGFKSAVADGSKPADQAAAAVPGVSDGQVKKKKKKKKPKKEDDLAVRANAWQQFNAKSGKKKSIFASPEEGSTGRVGFHGSSNTMTSVPDRKRHEFAQN